MKESAMKKLRKSRDLRLIDLAERIGISASWLWSLENGYEKGISQEVKVKVALALGSDVSELFGKYKQTRGSTEDNEY